ncbi:MAG: Do family serine endopeptidase, partial [Hyphomicrobiales bacterium]
MMHHSPNSKSNPGTRRRKAPVALAVAGLLGATALTIPFFASETSLVASGARAATQSVAPAEGFADLVEKIKPAVVSVKVRNGGHSTSSHGNENSFRDDIPGGETFKRFFENFGYPFERQSFNGDDRYGSGLGYRNEDGDGRTYRGGTEDGRDYGHYDEDDGDHDGFSRNHRKREGRRNRPHRRYGRSQGSGFIISADGYVVTNQHVVANASKIELTLSDGKTYEAKLVGADAKTDLALLKMDAERSFEFVGFTEAPARVGDWVIAVGNPFGLGGSVTTGIVSARGRDLGSGPYDDYIQIDAPINRGNSGGPAFNINGEVIGVNTAIFSPSGGNVGIGFAIPAAIAKSVIEDLRDDGKVTRGWLGVQIQPVSDDIASSLGLDTTTGAMVAEVQGGSPAEKAGLKVGDVVLSVNGDEVKDPKDLALKISGFTPGTKVELSILRDGKTVTETVSLGTLPGGRKRADAKQDDTPSQTSLGALGLTVTETDGAVMVASVKPDGAAAAKGLKRGDQILEIAGTPVSTAEEFKQQLKIAR